jgi:hypothetical protein
MAIDYHWAIAVVIGIVIIMILGILITILNDGK